MAQKPIREVTAKQLIADHYAGEGKPEIRFATVNPETDLQNLPQAHPWLLKGRLVAKVDELFGKRGKMGYVHIAESFEEATRWIEKLRGTQACVGGRTGRLDHFLLEPFIKHKNEYYLAFTCERERDVILFSESGGMEVEEQEDSITRIPVELNGKPDLSSLPESLRPTVEGLFTLFRSLDFSFFESNPLTEVDGKVFLLDARARVDTCSLSRQRGSWGSVAIPDGFGNTCAIEEGTIRDLDSKSGSSLKFVLLNPAGRVWTMVAGGGASIIYTDAILRQIPVSLLGNYGEWSGNPSTAEMETYTNEILKVISRNAPEPQGLIIGGGIANFTDIAKTFEGIIRALKSHISHLPNLRLYVRRAGPNDRQGLSALQKACDEMGIPCVTYGAEMPMTKIVEIAIEQLNECSSVSSDSLVSSVS